MGKQAIDVGVYFALHAPLTEYASVRIRAVNALVRGGISTMDELCGASAEEIEKIRNLGERSLKLALIMREKYSEE